MLLKSCLNAVKVPTGQRKSSLKGVRCITCAAMFAPRTRSTSDPFFNCYERATSAGWTCGRGKRRLTNTNVGIAVTLYCWAICGACQPSMPRLALLMPRTSRAASTSTLQNVAPLYCWLSFSYVGATASVAVEEAGQQ